MASNNPFQIFQEIAGASDTVTSVLHLLAQVKSIDLNGNGTPDIIDLKTKAEAWFGELKTVIQDGAALIKEGEAIFGDLRQKIGVATNAKPSA